MSGPAVVNARSHQRRHRLTPRIVSGRQTLGSRASTIAVRLRPTGTSARQARAVDYATTCICHHRPQLPCENAMKVTSQPTLTVWAQRMAPALLFGAPGAGRAAALPMRNLGTDSSFANLNAAEGRAPDVGVPSPL